MTRLGLEVGARLTFPCAPAPARVVGHWFPFPRGRREPGRGWAAAGLSQGARRPSIGARVPGELVLRGQARLSCSGRARPCPPLQQENKVLKIELETYKLKCKALQEENRDLRKASVTIVSAPRGCAAAPTPARPREGLHPDPGSPRDPPDSRGPAARTLLAETYWSPGGEGGVPSGPRGSVVLGGPGPSRGGGGGGGGGGKSGGIVISPFRLEELTNRLASLQQENKVLKIELETYKLKCKALQEENRDLRKASVTIQARAEQEEEFISNTLFKKIQALQKEKETLAVNYEKEEEFLTNELSRKLMQLQHEKAELEQHLEQEQEFQVNKLMKKIKKLENDTISKQLTLEQLIQFQEIGFVN
ncbi:PREDICTED: transcription factor Maf-like [Galeopterus variegatus]|uniref:Transcription factor Maf-like n=1 Tax=Galeopterus variegatus TaxID=482537 RepID=A0ABM0RKC3_GALVR|nr:PREDICTED: transcription factor Maf-like [Galeopterus variegatus]